MGVVGFFFLWSESSPSPAADARLTGGFFTTVPVTRTTDGGFNSKSRSGRSYGGFETQPWLFTPAGFVR